MLLQNTKKAKIYLKDGNVLIGESQGTDIDEEGDECAVFKPTFSLLYCFIKAGDIIKAEAIE